MYIKAICRSLKTLLYFHFNCLPLFLFLCFWWILNINVEELTQEEVSKGSAQGLGEMVTQWLDERNKEGRKGGKKGGVEEGKKKNKCKRCHLAG